MLATTTLGSQPVASSTTGLWTQLLGALQRRLPEDMAALAEGLDSNGLLNTEEYELALAHARRGSVPGLDGLP